MTFKNYIKSKGLNNNKLSKRAKVAESTISEFINKKRDITFNTACKISDALGITLDELRKINSEN